jgi:hypothetical protein
LQWFRAQISKPRLSAWHRHLPSLLQGKEALRYGPLVFTLTNSTAAESWNVGGADGSGIGGADGSGIGGSGEATPEALNTVSVELDQEADAERRAMAIENTTADAWRKDLLKGGKITVPFLLEEKAQRLRKISSLAQFVTLWQRDRFRPLALRSAANARAALPGFP